MCQCMFVGMHVSACVDVCLCVSVCVGVCEKATILNGSLPPITLNRALVLYIQLQICFFPDEGIHSCPGRHSRHGICTPNTDSM